MIEWMDGGGGGAVPKYRRNRTAVTFFATKTGRDIFAQPRGHDDKFILALVA
jgi:hypothetical protein